MKKIICMEYTAINIDDNCIRKYRKGDDYTCFTNYIRIYTPFNDFMKNNPPCQTCLIQSMCVREKFAHPTLDSIPDHLQIKICDKLIEFVDNHNSFSK